MSPNPRKQLNPAFHVRCYQARFFPFPDGPREVALKGRLCKYLVNRWEIKRAYLARAEPPGGERVLCLASPFGHAARQEISDEAAGIFFSLYEVGESIDIVFLEDDQEVLLAKTCPLFYIRREPSIFPTAPTRG